ncbi:MAG: hypothetical protein V1736_03615 [Pseudomonadota bacterium]
MGALSVGDARTGTIPSLLPSQKHYLKVYSPGVHDWPFRLMAIELTHHVRF